MLDRHDRERALDDEQAADDKKQPTPPPQPEPDETSEPASPRDYQEGFWGQRINRGRGDEGCGEIALTAFPAIEA